MNAVHALPTAAAAPVANLRRRGRYPQGVTSIRQGAVLRARRTEQEKAQSGSLKIGDYVVIWQGHSTNSNNGRVGQIVAQDRCFAPAEMAWQIEAVGALFDIGGDPENGKTTAAVFRDVWLLPMSADSAKFYDSARAGR